MYWVCAVWPKAHTEQKLMISWAFYSLCVGIATRLAGFIRDLAAMCNKNDLAAQQNPAIGCMACVMSVGSACFQAGWCIIGIMRFLKMEKTNDTWLTYGILTELVIASLMGVIVYAVILIMLLLCSFACCIGCELDHILNQLPEKYKGTLSNSEGKADKAKILALLTGMGYKPEKQSPVAVTNENVNVVGNEQAGQEGGKGKADVDVKGHADVEEKVPLKTED